MTGNDNAKEPIPQGTLVQTRAPNQAYLPAPTDPPEKWPTSIDVSTPLGKSLVLKMVGPPTLTVAEAGDKEYVVMGYLLRPAEHMDEETGELSQYHQLTLLLSDGRTLGSPGPLFLRKWLMVLRMMGSPGPSNPISVRVMKGKSRRPGRMYDDLELVSDF